LVKLKEYIFTQLSLSFFPTFGILFLITSIIFILKIASLTSVITINFLELLEIYSYQLPNILFFTLPVSFFISIVLAISKLCLEYELIVITAFGLNPLRVVKIILPFALLVSSSLLIISLALIPKAKYLNSSLISQKKKEASFNIKASEFGQKFGDWMVYIESDNESTYGDIKLFSKSADELRFILASSAKTSNRDGKLNLELQSGKSFILADKLNQINFKTMNIYDSLANSKEDSFISSYHFWMENIDKRNKYTKDFVFYILVALFPLISLLFVLSFGYFNPRYDKNRASTYAIATITIYYVLSYFLAKSIFLYAIPVVISTTLIFSYYLYAKKIKALY
jgi:lipopolysaccharide export system permease protein